MFCENRSKPDFHFSPREESLGLRRLARFMFSSSKNKFGFRNFSNGNGAERMRCRKSNGDLGIDPETNTWFQNASRIDQWTSEKLHHQWCSWKVWKIKWNLSRGTGLGESHFPWCRRPSTSSCFETDRTPLQIQLGKIHGIPLLQMLCSEWRLDAIGIWLPSQPRLCAMPCVRKLLTHKNHVRQIQPCSYHQITTTRPRTYSQNFLKSLQI